MGILQEGELNEAIEVMMKLNDIGSKLGKIEGVSAITDVTGFGFAGHLLEMCEGSNLSAEIEFNKLPILASTKNYAYSFIAPKGFTTNWEAIKNKISDTTESQRVLLGDPQTSGGLLIAVKPELETQISGLLKANGLYQHAIGKLIKKETDSKIELI